MEPSLGAAARALAAFDPLRALGFVALRDDAEGLALRGVAMAQLGDFPAARRLLSRAAASFGEDAADARARCLAAEAEVALAARDLHGAEIGLRDAAGALEACGDRVNAAFVRLQEVRRLLLAGLVADARGSLERLERRELRGAPPRLVAIAALVAADVAMRGLRPRDARASLERAKLAARGLRTAALTREIERLASELDAPVARVRERGNERSASLDEVYQWSLGHDLVVDACRRQVRAGARVISLVTRPVLLALAVALGERAPSEATRAQLIAGAFGGKRVTDSMRARLRVEIGRLRRSLAPVADVRAEGEGFVLTPRRAGEVRVLLPPEADEASVLLALLAGGDSWSTSALAAATGTSARTVQRKLAALLGDGRVEAIGDGRARRWVAPPPAGFATTLLLVTRTAAVAPSSREPNEPSARRTPRRGRA